MRYGYVNGRRMADKIAENGRSGRDRRGCSFVVFLEHQLLSIHPSRLSAKLSDAFSLASPRNLGFLSSACLRPPLALTTTFPLTADDAFQTTFGE